MSNLTITVDEEVLRRARIRALEQRTSVNQVLGELLRAYAGDNRTVDAVERALAVSEGQPSGSGQGGRKWRREDLYER